MPYLFPAHPGTLLSERGISYPKWGQLRPHPYISVNY